MTDILHRIRRKVTKDQSRDTGMAAVLLLLILYLSFGRKGLLFCAIACQVIGMTVPEAYRPLAVVWLGLADLLGAVVSKVLMSIVFFAIVTPIGVCRRLMGKDPLKLREFKVSEDSVLWARNHVFTGRDLERPY